MVTEDECGALLVSYEGLDTVRNLLDAFAHICSKKGKRWAGFTARDDETKNAAKSWDWQEAHLPTWHVSYKFGKRLEQGA